MWKDGKKQKKKVKCVRIFLNEIFTPSAVPPTDKENSNKKVVLFYAFNKMERK